jgi:hypothetical protein
MAKRNNAGVPKDEIERYGKQASNGNLGEQQVIAGKGEIRQYRQTPEYIFEGFPSRAGTKTGQ